MTLPGRTMDLTPLAPSSLYPSGARNMGRYVLFAPGVVRVFGQNEFSTNGHRGRENNFMMDGVDNNDNTVTLPAVFAPPEAISEFQVQIATYSAEFGRSMGAQVNAVTKTGTTNFRRSQEFYRKAGRRFKAGGRDSRLRRIWSTISLAVISADRSSRTRHSFSV
jgi:hypothetical protein